MTGNGWNGTLTGGASLVAGIKGNAVDLSGTSQYVALPAGVVSSANAITVAAWVNLDTISNWARIFDFGSDTTHYMFLTPKNGANGFIRFGIKNGGTEQIHRRDCGAAYRRLASCGRNLERRYGNDLCRWTAGRQRQHQHQTIPTRHYHAESDRPLAILHDPYLDGRVDDFRIYNSALTAQEVSAVMNE